MFIDSGLLSVGFPDDLSRIGSVSLCGFWKVLKANTAEIPTEYI